MPSPGDGSNRARKPLNWRDPLGIIEWLGNKLPDPVMLFILAALAVVVLSALGDAAGWKVTPLRPVVVTRPLLDDQGRPVLDEAGKPRLAPVLDEKGVPKVTLERGEQPITSRSLLSSEGIYWAITNLVRNFINFPPLGLVLVGMLGIGVAEKVGFFGAAMKWLAAQVPGSLLTPTIIFLGVMSSVASDAGYIILPPLAGALYLAVGRPPAAGVAAAFAGVAGGFSANLFPTAGDALVAGITTSAARILEPAHSVNPLCNWYFQIASTFLLAAVGWLVTARVVEPRLRRHGPEEGGPVPVSAEEAMRQRLGHEEARALRLAALAMLAALALVLCATLIPGAPLHGRVDPDNPRSALRYTQGIVPIIFVMFLAPGLAYGFATGTLRSATDVSKAFIHAMVTMAPIIVLAFFAAQFIEFLKYSNLDRMLAFVGGEALAEAGLPRPVLLACLVLLSLTVNLLIGSMSAKWAMLSPIIVPMLMIVGISPELAQVTYRVGDSVTNIVTPLNSYILVVLVVMQRYWKNAGLGSLIATMLPYSVVFTIVWTAMLLAWVALGLMLGPEGPLDYVPGH